MERKIYSTTNHTTVPSASSKTKSALDTVVSSLVRAAIGGDVHAIKDEDLNKYVADLILKESREKSKLFDKVGTRAYLPNTGVPECTLPKTNKRFLLNIVKSTDGHNRALLRQARELANARLRELRERDTLRDCSPSDGEREEKRRGRGSEDGKGRKRRREPDRDVGSSRRELRRFDEGSEKVRDNIGGPSTTRDPTSNGGREPSLTPSDREGTRSASRSALTTRFRETEPGPVKFKGRGKIGGSKMDKYFDPTYDPAYDVSDAEPDLWGRVPVAAAIKQKDGENLKMRKRKKKSKEMKVGEEERKKSKSRRKKTRDRSDSEQSDSSVSYSSSSAHSSRKAKSRGRRKVYADSGSDDSGNGDSKPRDRLSPSRYEKVSKRRDRNRTRRDKNMEKETPQKKWDGIPKLPPACPW